MKKFNSRETILSVVTISLLSLALVYVYLIEPYGNRSADIKGVSTRYNKSVFLKEHKNEIERTARLVFAPVCWKQTPDEQQLALQMRMEEMLRAAKIQKVLSMYPMQAYERKGSTEIRFKIDAECSLESLASLLSMTAKSAVPFRILKLQINSPEEGAGLLKVHFEISSLWFSVSEELLKGTGGL